MRWSEHFVWSSDKLKIIALTEIGKAAIELLELNRLRILLLREADAQINRHPPPKDPIQI